ncbi:L,D-transpeptidase [Rhizomonospora bruguierae]|uniref:L,D-transpeptidase n=1 Tax=Rhizomonospora bruguierae TaxID=1581705 RepID=UPI001BCFCB36|nr:Ig-like domain-containing protein [Micromonospora sp. NBRC 107566]
MSRVGRAWAAAILAAAVCAAVAGCSDGGERAAPPGGPSPTATPSTAPTTVPPLTLAVTPAVNAKNLPVSAEIGTRVTGGSVSTVTLRDSAGKAVAGSLREDGSAWVPRSPLKYDRVYTATVTAAGGGQTMTQTTTFRTMKEPGRRTDTGLYLFDGHTYGVAMPVVVEFHPGIANKDRAEVQRRMFVTSTPSQPGAWSWVANGTQAYYRPPVYWQPGTKVTVRIAVGGHPTGGGRYGDRDRGATATIGRAFEMKVDNRTKVMSVYQDGRVIRTVPVSLGKRSTPSSSGTMVVMEKKASTVFDTYAELGPREGYRTEIDFAQRITWSGQYIHSAPWSVGSQGRRNVSHGCVNVSPSNARWLFERTRVGDPITVLGTERKLAAGDGWTAWNQSWAEFVKGSALPVPAELAAAG